MNKFILVIGMLMAVIFAVLSGCTVEGELEEGQEDIVITCTDTRDGEVFSFNTDSITNLRLGYGSPSSYDMVTLGGNKMTISTGMESYLKCTQPNH